MNTGARDHVMKVAHGMQHNGDGFLVVYGFLLGGFLSAVGAFGAVFALMGGTAESMLISLASLAAGFAGMILGTLIRIKTLLRAQTFFLEHIARGKALDTSSTESDSGRH